MKIERAVTGHHENWRQICMAPVTARSIFIVIPRYVLEIDVELGTEPARSRCGPRPAPLLPQAIEFSLRM